MAEILDCMVSYFSEDTNAEGLPRRSWRGPGRFLKGRSPQPQNGQSRTAGRRRKVEPRIGAE